MIIVDSTVELEDDVIIMQDAEKCIYFFESEGGRLNRVFEVQKNDIIFVMYAMGTVRLYLMMK